MKVSHHLSTRLYRTLRTSKSRQLPFVFSSSFSFYVYLLCVCLCLQHQYYFNFCYSSPIPFSSPESNLNESETSRPNVLLLIVDDLRSTLGGIKGIDDANGIIKTPNIAKLVKEGGTLFNHAYAQIALCAPSRNSFLTGRRPDTTLAYQFVDHFREAGIGFEWTSLPELFKHNGYISVGAGKVFHPDLPPHWDLPRSWDRRMSSGVWDTWMYPKEERCSNNSTWCYVEKKEEIQDLQDFKTTQVILEMLRNISSLKTPAKETEIAEGVEARLEVQDESDNDHVSNAPLPSPPPPSTSPSPFFLAAGFRKPHLQWKFPKYILDDFYPSLSDNHGVDKINDDEEDDDDDRIPLPAPAQQVYPAGNANLGFHMPVDDFLLDFDDVRNCSSANFSPSFIFPKECIKTWRRAYFASVTWIDVCIGQIIEELEKLKMKDNTIIALVGDHGWHLGNMGMYEKFSNFDVAVRTPLIFGKLPTNVLMKRSKLHLPTHKPPPPHQKQERQLQQERQQPELVEDVVELIDIYPTLATLAGLDLPTKDTAPLDGKSLHDYLLPDSVGPFPSLSPLSVSSSLVSSTTSSSSLSSLKEEPVALSQFPRCANGLNYNTILREDIPLSDMNRLTFEIYNNGTIPTYRHPTIDPLPNWKLTNCNDVKREDFTYMGLSIRTKQYRLTNWYEWRGYKGILDVDWERGPIEQELYLHSTDPSTDIDLDGQDFETNNIAKEREYQSELKYLNTLLEHKFNHFQKNAITKTINLKLEEETKKEDSKAPI